MAIADIDTSFYDDYLVLKPEEGSFGDILRLLLSNKVENNRFLECPKGTELTGLKRRWLLCISLAVQVFLLRIKNPMKRFGSAVEWPYVCLLSWRVVRPEPGSASYRSFIGYLDERLELDKDIKHGDWRYVSALAAMTAKLAYENQAFIERTVRDVWKMDFVEYYDCWNDFLEQSTTQAFMFIDNSTAPGLIVISFRGTESFDADDWVTDFDFSFLELLGMGRVHAGFMKALGLQKRNGWPKEIGEGGNRPKFAYYAIRERLRDVLEKNENAKFMVTGHSLGGALAVLFPAILAVHDEVRMLERMEGLYTFGQPRVGDENFGQFLMDHFNKHGVKYFRFVYCNDIVPRVPYDDETLWFKHFGTCLYYNSVYKGKVILSSSLSISL
ncbi:hypothetical protein ACLOJK_013762 [Asimina triloba]